MQPKSLKWLNDIRSSARLILDSTKDKNVDDYYAEHILRAAVERHFEIIGEAMNRLAHHDPDIASQIAYYKRIIAFRNVLIHGYDLVDHSDVWNVIRDDLPDLLNQIEKLLEEYETEK